MQFLDSRFERQDELSSHQRHDVAPRVGRAHREAQGTSRAIRWNASCDVALPLAERHGTSLLIAARRGEPRVFPGPASRRSPARPGRRPTAAGVRSVAAAYARATQAR